MSLRLIVIIVTCGTALAHNIDRIDEHELAGSSFDAEVHPVQFKSVHRRQIPEVVADDAASGTGALSAVQISDLSQDNGSVDKKKRSTILQSEHKAEPGCCG